MWYVSFFQQPAFNITAMFHSLDRKESVQLFFSLSFPIKFSCVLDALVAFILIAVARPFQSQICSQKDGFLRPAWLEYCSSDGKCCARWLIQMFVVDDIQSGADSESSSPLIGWAMTALSCIHLSINRMDLHLLICYSVNICVISTCVVDYCSSFLTSISSCFRHCSALLFTSHAFKYYLTVLKGLFFFLLWVMILNFRVGFRQIAVSLFPISV